MSSYEKSFEHMSSVRLKEAREGYLAELLHGVSFDDYNRLIGAIRAIDETLKIFEDVKKAILHE